MPDFHSQLAGCLTHVYFTTNDLFESIRNLRRQQPSLSPLAQPTSSGMALLPPAPYPYPAGVEGSEFREMLKS